MPNPNDDQEGLDETGGVWKFIRVSPETHALFAACAENSNCTMDQVAALTISSYLDRSTSGYHVENAHLVREVIALETRLEQLVLSNLSLAETLFALEGDGLRSLIQLTQLAKKQIAEGENRPSGKKA